MTDAEKISALQKSMGEPVGFDISEAAAKIKRNLILISSVVLVLIFGGVEAAPGVSIFGISLTGVTSTKLMLGLSIVLFYSLAHYLWYCYELYSEWVIRLSGAKLGFITAGIFGADGLDYPSDPKQSTLYNWWRSQSYSVFDCKEVAANVEAQLESMKLSAERTTLGDVQFSGSAEILQELVKLKESVEAMNRALVATESVVSHERIPVSLARFDRRFGLLLKSQNLRVLLVEIMFPLALAAFSAVSLLRFFTSQ